MTRKVKTVRAVLAAASLTLFVWSILPVVADGMFGVGVAVPMALAIGGAVCALWWRPRRKGWKIMTIVLCTAVALILVLGGVCTGLMVGAAHTQPAPNATAVVLGSKIHGDQPSRMLRDRLDAAADYLERNPDAHCVVAGGLGPGETYTEAYVMKKYLVEQRGIDPDRIAREDRSTNTQENLAFSLEIIRRQGWSTHVVVATQVFHQYRAGRMALSAGAASVGGAACYTPRHLLLNYWFRECAAIGRLWVFGI